MPIKGNFSIGQVIDPTKGAQAALSNVQSIMQQQETIKNNRINQQLVEQRQVMQQQNADRTFDLQTQQNSDTADYRLQQQTNDQLKFESRKAYQNRMAAGVEGERQYNKDMATGETMGNFIDIQDRVEGDPTRVFDPEVGKTLLDQYDAEHKATTPTEVDMLKKYNEYLLVNDPDYAKKLSLSEKANTAQRNISKDIASTGLSANIFATAAKYGSKLFTPDKSQQEEVTNEIAELEKPPKPEGILSRRDFQAKFDADNTKQAKVQQKERKAFATDILTNKKGAAYSDSTVKKYDRVPRAEMLAAAQDAIYDKQKARPKGKKYSKATMEGMFKTAVANIDKIKDARVLTDTAVAEQFTKDRDRAMDASYKEKLEVLKSKLKREPTFSEKSKIKKTLLETKLLEQKYQDNKGFFDFS